MMKFEQTSTTLSMKLRSAGKCTPDADANEAPNRKRNRDCVRTDDNEGNSSTSACARARACTEDDDEDAEASIASALASASAYVPRPRRPMNQLIRFVCVADGPMTDEEDEIVYRVMLESLAFHAHKSAIYFGIYDCNDNEVVEFLAEAVKLIQTKKNPNDSDSECLELANDALRQFRKIDESTNRFQIGNCITSVAAFYRHVFPYF